jgi:hypothetical protein
MAHGRLGFFFFFLASMLLACGGRAGEVPATEAGNATGDDAGGRGVSARGDNGAADAGSAVVVVADGGHDTGGKAGGDASHLPCGAGTCVLPGEVCCALLTRASWDKLDADFACVAGSECPPAPPGPPDEHGVAAISCTLDANCGAGSACCVATSESPDGSFMVTTSCRASCSADTQHACDPSLPTLTACEHDMICEPLDVPELAVCRPMDA